MSEPTYTHTLVGGRFSNREILMDYVPNIIEVPYIEEVKNVNPTNSTTTIKREVYVKIAKSNNNYYYKHTRTNREGTR